MNNQSIQQALTALIPITQIAALVGQALPWFVGIGIVILFCGMMMQSASNHPETVLMRGIAIAGCMAISPLLLTWLEQSVAQLVTAIGNIAPQLNWLIVNNPGQNALVMDFTKPFAALAQYVGGSFSTTTAPSGFATMDLSKWFEYGWRMGAITVTGFFAAVTVFIMEIFLIIQKMVILGSELLLPVMIPCLLLPSGHASAITFCKHLLGVACWPVGWAIVHIGTMAFLQTLKTPSWTAPLAELTLTAGWLVIVCFMLIGATIAAPFYIHRFIMHGDNFAQHLVGDMASSIGRHASQGAQSAGRIAGGAAGSVAGPVGVGVGAALGGSFGGSAALPFTGATEAAGAINSGHRAAPSSTSRGAADSILQGMRARA